MFPNVYDGSRVRVQLVRPAHIFGQLDSFAVDDHDGRGAVSFAYLPWNLGCIVGARSQRSPTRTRPRSAGTTSSTELATNKRPALFARLRFPHARADASALGLVDASPSFAASSTIAAASSFNLAAAFALTFAGKTPARGRLPLILLNVIRPGRSRFSVSAGGIVECASGRAADFSWLRGARRGAAAVFGLLVRLRFVATLEGSLVLFDSFACRYSARIFLDAPPM